MKRKVRMQEWGNSIVLPIPIAVAEKLELRPNSQVELVIEDDKIVVAPVTRPEYSLDELLAGITGENRHDEVDTGAATGHEAW